MRKKIYRYEVFLVEYPFNYKLQFERERERERERNTWYDMILYCFKTSELLPRNRWHIPKIMQCRYVNGLNLCKLYNKYWSWFISNQKIVSFFVSNEQNTYVLMHVYIFLHFVLCKTKMIGHIFLCKNSEIKVLPNYD